MSKKISSYLAYLLIFISVLIYGMYTGVQKQGLVGIPNPLSFAFYTMVYCSLFLFPFALYSFIKSTNKKEILSKPSLRSLFLISILSQFFAITIKLYALQLTTATSVAFIASFSSITLSFYSVVLLKEKLPRYFFSVLFLMSIGLLLFRYEGQGFTLSFGPGEMLAMLFICLTSLSNAIAKLTMNKKTPPFITSFGRMIFAMPILGLFVFITGNFDSSQLLSFWPAFAGLLFATRVITLYSGINLTKLSNVAIFTIFAPTITFAYGFIMLDEKLNWVQILGALIILIGTYLMIVIKKKEKLYTSTGDK